MIVNSVVHLVLLHLYRFIAFTCVLMLGVDV